MVSRDGKCFYWVVFKLLPSGRNNCEMWTMCHSFCCWENCYKLPSRNYLDICFPTFIWILPILHNHCKSKKLKVFSIPRKSQPTSVFSSVKLTCSLEFDCTVSATSTLLILLDLPGNIKYRVLAEEYSNKLCFVGL